MDIRETYLLAMREQAPSMHKELSRTGALQAHLNAKAAEAQQMFEYLTEGLPKYPDGTVKDMNARHSVEEQVRAALIEFPQHSQSDVGGGMIPQPSREIDEGDACQWDELGESKAEKQLRLRIIEKLRSATRNRRLSAETRAKAKVYLAMAQHEADEGKPASTAIFCAAHTVSKIPVGIANLWKASAMTDKRNMLLALCIGLGILFVATAFRYQVINKRDALIVRVDRWTGNVEFCDPGGCMSPDRRTK